MKKLTLTLCILATSYASAQVGINTNMPNATLDVVGQPSETTSLDGIIAPRLTGDELRTKTYTADQTGAMVYITAADTSPAGQTVNVTKMGYYVFNGTTWVSVASSLPYEVDLRLVGISNHITQDAGPVGDGSSAGSASATNNVFIGDNSGASNTNGDFNVALGSSALPNNTTGTANIAIGQESFGGTTALSTNDNIAIGRQSGANSLYTSSTGNVFVGVNAGSNSDFRLSSILMGDSAGASSTFGGSTIVIGRSAARNLTMDNSNTRSGNIIIGDTAGQNGGQTNAWRGNNTVIGSAAARGGQITQNNIVIGSSSATNASLSQNNTVIGPNTAQASSLNAWNIVMGNSAGNNATLDRNNVIIGPSAAANLSMNRENTLLGVNTTATAANVRTSTALGAGATITKSNQTVIGGAGNTEVAINGRLVLLSSGSALNNEAGLYQATETVIPTSTKGIYAFDSDGNATQISPHNFSIIPEGASEEMAWAFYSKNEKLGKEVNVDMMKLTRKVEELTGEQLVYMQDLATGESIENQNAAEEGTLNIILQRLQQLEKENASLKQRIEVLENQ